MPQAVNRPGTVMFVAIVLFLFGTLYTLNALSSGVGAAIVAASADAADANAKIQPGDIGAMLRFIATEIPGYVPISLGIAVLDFIFGITQLICGLNVLRLKPFARRFTIGLILVRLIYVLGYDAFATVVVLPIEIRYFERQAVDMQQADPQQAEAARIVMNIASYGVYAVLAFKVFVEIFAAALIIILLSTARTKAAFAGIVETPPEEPPQKPPSQYVGYDDEEGYSPPSTGIQERS